MPKGRECLWLTQIACKTVAKLRATLYRTGDRLADASPTRQNGPGQEGPTVEDVQTLCRTWSFGGFIGG